MVLSRSVIGSSARPDGAGAGGPARRGLLDRFPSGGRERASLAWTECLRFDAATAAARSTSAACDGPGALEQSFGQARFVEQSSPRFVVAGPLCWPPSTRSSAQQHTPALALAVPRAHEAMSCMRQLNSVLGNSRVAVARASFRPRPRRALARQPTRDERADLPLASPHTVLLPLAGLAYLAYALCGDSTELGRVAGASYSSSASSKPGSLVHQCEPGLLTSQTPAALESTLDELLHVPKEEVGGIAICASIKNEARFITEWLLYVRLLSPDSPLCCEERADTSARPQNRANGVDRFYLCVLAPSSHSSSRR